MPMVLFIKIKVKIIFYNCLIQKVLERAVGSNPGKSTENF